MGRLLVVVACVALMRAFRTPCTRAGSNYVATIQNRSRFENCSPCTPFCPFRPSPAVPLTCSGQRVHHVDARASRSFFLHRRGLLTRGRVPSGVLICSTAGPEQVSQDAPPGTLAERLGDPLPDIVPQPVPVPVSVLTHSLPAKPRPPLPPPPRVPPSAVRWLFSRAVSLFLIRFGSLGRTENHRLI